MSTSSPLFWYTRNVHKDISHILALPNNWSNQHTKPWVPDVAVESFYQFIEFVFMSSFNSINYVLIASLNCHYHEFIIEQVTSGASLYTSLRSLIVLGLLAVDWVFLSLGEEFSEEKPELTPPLWCTSVNNTCLDIPTSSNTTFRLM